MDRTTQSSIKCLIVEDEPLATRLLEKHIAQFPQLQLIGNCWNAMEAMNVIRTHSIDLLFLDVQLPSITGLELLKSLDNPPAVILTTAYREYAVESYEFNVIDYLLKPITLTRFFKAIQKLPQNQSQIKTESIDLGKQYLIINSNRRYHKIDYQDIEYIESLKDYIRIVTPNKRFVTKEKISTFEQNLPANFLRIHRSYIIHLSKVRSFTAQSVEINSEELPIGISYRRIVSERLQRS